MSSNERGSTSDTLPGCAESGSQVRERYVSDLDDIPTHHASADAADNVRMLQMENAALIDGLRALNDQVRRLEAERNLFLLAGTEQRGLPAMQRPAELKEQMPDFAVHSARQDEYPNFMKRGRPVIRASEGARRTRSEEAPRTPGLRGTGEACKQNCATIVIGEHARMEYQ